MNTQKKCSLTFSLALLLLSLSSRHSYAYEPILRDFHSVRSAGMGDVRYTTGVFEENLFANPARSTENPENLLILPKLSVEAGKNAIDGLGDLSNSGEKGLSAFGDKVGKPMSARVQLTFPGYFHNKFITDDWAIGVAVNIAAATVPVVSQSGNIDPNTFVAAGPAINLARRLLDDRLSIGVNWHTQFRVSARSNYSLTDYFAGTKIADIVKGGNGIGYDFDLGTTFRPHWTMLGLQYELAFAVNNILGGKYKNISHPIKEWIGDPFVSHRAFNFGVSGLSKELLFFNQVVFAIESTDIGNNENGSFYRTLHLGTEAKVGVLAGRLGVNQGYFAAGLGLDLVYFDLNLATYGEELTLNTGKKEDRRYAVELGFKI